MYTLGIETSCDETSCAILKDYKVLSNVTISSLKEHSKYGGVIPEIATRAHLQNIDKVFNLSLKKAKISLKQIDLITVTSNPGLIGALVVGLNFAKALAYSLNKPLLGVNHLHAHIFAPFLNSKEKIEFPFLGLIVSGGHTEIYLVKDFDKIELIGQTRDDACGEVYDKVAKSIGLPYPGGPTIDKMFDPKYKNEFKFKCGKIGFDLSFSGIKTAFIYKKKELEKEAKLDKKTKIKLASSFQESVVTTIVKTVLEASVQYKIKKIACGGGVIANKYLRTKMLETSDKDVKWLISPIEYAMDNAAIVAGLGFYLYNTKRLTSDLTLGAHTS